MLKEERTRKAAAYSRYRIRFLARTPFSRALDFKGVQSYALTHHVVCESLGYLVDRVLSPL
jgi:hypothetical protein